MVMVMLFSWQITQDSKYQGAFNKSLEAYYQGSEYKTYVNNIEGRARNTAPILVDTGAAGYSLTVKKQVSLTTNKIVIIPGTSTTYTYNTVKTTGNIGIIWSF